MNLGAARSAFRRELGLPDRGRIVMTGHQCSVWHPGILAKYVACDRMVGATGGGAGAAERSEGSYDSAAWLWVDQDSDETHTLRVPVRENGRLVAREWRLKPAPSVDVAAASMPAFEPAPFVGEPALASVRDGVGAIIIALRRHTDEPNAARQVAAGVTELMAPYLGHPRPPAVFATEMMRTSLGAALIARMRDDPRGCVEHYNRAVLANPGARVATLGVGDGEGGAELPMWWLAPGSARRRVFARDLREGLIGLGSLAPRALLMTGMARFGACDLFIHGRGGGLYDGITEAWFGAWLGVGLAPTRVVSADLLLPLRAERVSERDVARAAWRAHRAGHDPGVLGDAPGANLKRKLLAEIEARRHAGESPAETYRAMHRALEAYRQSRRAELDALGGEVERVRRGLSEARVATDRTWAFPFYDAGALRGLAIV